MINSRRWDQTILYGNGLNSNFQNLVFVSQITLKTNRIKYVFAGKHAPPATNHFCLSGMQAKWCDFQFVYSHSQVLRKKLKIPQSNPSGDESVLALEQDNQIVGKVHENNWAISLIAILSQSDLSLFQFNIIDKTTTKLMTEVILCRLTQL